MYKTYHDLPDVFVKQKIAQYCYDYFFHYLLMESEKIRLALCRYLSGDDTIERTFIETAESYIPYYGGKKLVMDHVMRDDRCRTMILKVMMKSDSPVIFIGYWSDS